MQDWLFIVKSTEPTLDGELVTKERALELAEKARRGDWWLSRWRRMEAKDRVWLHFASPVKEIAAVAEVEGEPREVTGDSEYPWRFPGTLSPEATRRLYRNPVPLRALVDQHPQGVTRVKDEDLKLLLRHAGL